MNKPISSALAVSACLLTLHASALAEAGKLGPAAQQAANATGNPDAVVDNNLQTGNGPAGPVKAEASKGKAAAPPQTQPKARQSPDGSVPNLADDSHTIKGDAKPGFFSDFMKSGAPYIFGGAILGGVIGGLVGGPIGFLLGGLLGVIGGYVAHQLLK